MPVIILFKKPELPQKKPEKLRLPIFLYTKQLMKNLKSRLKSERLASLHKGHKAMVTGPTVPGISLNHPWHFHFGILHANPV